MIRPREEPEGFAAFPFPERTEPCPVCGETVFWVAGETFACEGCGFGN